ncbi:formin-2 [Drosophila serrata]|uniref:formin-2 n=1 Tax=Drosophila serrata TaxID=7274 RepID=UPI000A1D2059|nr:formin-2 [Drosophila serrata]
MAPPPLTAQPVPHQQHLEQTSLPLPPPPTGQNIAPSGAFPGSLTPGWNDPPPVSAESLANNANSRRPRLDLRKRVAHPLDGQPGYVAPPADIASPRPVAMVPPVRQMPYPDPNCVAGASSDAGGPGAGLANVRLPPLAQDVGADPSRVPVARILPWQN